MQNEKINRVRLACYTVPLLLAACGGGGSDSGSTPVPTATTPVTTTPVVTTPVTTTPVTTTPVTTTPVTTTPVTTTPVTTTPVTTTPVTTTPVTTTPTVTPAPTPITCLAGNGAGTNGLMFYSPSGLTSFKLSTTAKSSNVNSSLTWGVQYSNVSNLTAGSYSGSLRARLWAVSRSYSGGTITGLVLGDYSPNFTGSGARSANQIYVGGFSTNTVTSSGTNVTPAYGSYCIVATLEQFGNGGYLIVDWVQFSSSVAFQ